MHYFQFNIGDYTRDTAHLSDMEDLAYRRMLDLYYKLEGPLPKDEQEIARLTRMRSHSDCIAVVLREFFVCTDDGYRNHRADKELSAIYSKSESAKKAANARWNKNKELSDANALRMACESDATHNTLHKTHNTEHKEEKKKATGVAAADAAIDFSPLCMTDEQIAEVKRIRKKTKGGALTQRVVNGLAAEFESAAKIGWGPEDILSEWELRGWKSFKAEWVSSKSSPAGGSRMGSHVEKTMATLENFNWRD